MNLTLTEAGVSVLDCEHKTPAPQTTGFPYIAIPDIQNGTVITGQCRLISKSDLEEWTRRTVPRGGDILVTRRGRVGDSAPIPEGLRCAIGQNLVLLRSDGTQVDQSFLRWATRSPQWWSEVDRLMNVGAVFSSLNVRDIAQIRLNIPPIRDQRNIAAVLGALENKIAANIALAETQMNLVDHLFPATRGTTSARLGDYVTVTKGNSYRSVDLGPSSTALVTLKSITRDGRYAYTGLKEFTGPYKAEQVVSAGEILVAQTDLTQSADVVGRAVRVPGDQKHKLVASLDLAVVRPSARVESLYLLGLLRQERFRTHARARTTGTTVLHLASGAIEEYEVPIASSTDQHKYAAKAAPLLIHAEGLAAENRILAATRDALLPQLMSGKLRMRDAEAIAADAGA